MARITVEDCVTRVPNRFELIMLAAHRARELSKGVPPTVDYDDDKNHVIALREIAEGTIDPATVTEALQMSLLGIDDDDDVAIDSDDAMVAMTAPLVKLDWDRVVHDWEDERAGADGQGARVKDGEAPDGYDDWADAE